MDSITTPSSLVGTAAPRYRAELALLALLLAEIVYLSVTFDTDPLDRIPSAWATFLGWSPLYLRLTIAMAGITLLLGGRQFVTAVVTLRHAIPAARLPYLTVHGLALFALVWLSQSLFAAGSHVAAHPALWICAWCLSAAITIGSWALAVFPLSFWRTVACEQRAVFAWGAAAGAAAWLGGHVTEGFWTPLARYTLSVVEWMLHGLYSDVVSIPERLVVGTSSFRVKIGPGCAGYEGVGLILAFLGIYLVWFRKELRFPGALMLLPIGAAAIWILNAVRIVALIAIGTAGWREIAHGGFHSQAGWLVFNAVGLVMVAAINRGGYFMDGSQRRPVFVADGRSDSTTAFLGPFVALLAAALATGAFSSGFDWLYPARLAAAGAVMWSCRRVYADVRWTCSLGALAIGIATFIVWLAMLPADLTAKDGWPTALQSVAPAWAGVWLAFRVLGYALVAPLVEELAFRGYLTRRLIDADIDNVPLGAVTWTSFLLSSLAFGVLHGRLWLAGTVAGCAFAFALYRRRSLGDAVLAHATTNGLIACYVFATGRWSVWS